MEWKIAIIGPLLKKLGLTIMHINYRSVRNMPCLSKVVEKVVLYQLGSHCTSYRLIPDYQSAYHANYSCKTALLKIVNDILWAMERQDITVLIAIDLSVAFNIVDHDILIGAAQKIWGCKDGLGMVCLIFKPTIL